MTQELRAIARIEHIHNHLTIPAGARGKVVATWPGGSVVVEWETLPRNYLVYRVWRAIELLYLYDRYTK